MLPVEVTSVNRNGCVSLSSAFTLPRLISYRYPGGHGPRIVVPLVARRRATSERTARSYPQTGYSRCCFQPHVAVAGTHRRAGRMRLGFVPRTRDPVWHLRHPTQIALTSLRTRDRLIGELVGGFSASVRRSRAQAHVVDPYPDQSRDHGRPSLSVPHAGVSVRVADNHRHSRSSTAPSSTALRCCDGYGLRIETVDHGRLVRVTPVTAQVLRWRLMLTGGRIVVVP